MKGSRIKGSAVLFSLSTALACSLAFAAATAKKDSSFAMKAAQGGASEVELGKLAQNQASDPKVKEFAQRMVADHSKANDELKSTASGMDLPSEPSKEQKAEIQRLTKLQGAEFDKEYSHYMLKDHEHDVADFKKEANSGQDPNIKGFAQKTLPTLEQHLQMARELPANAKGGSKKG